MQSSGDSASDVVGDRAVGADHQNSQRPPRRSHTDDVGHDHDGVRDSPDHVTDVHRSLPCDAKRTRLGVPLDWHVVDLDRALVRVDCD